jgi:hypothetical protein
MTRFFRYGGIAASVVLIAFGLAAIYMGFDGRSMVRSDLARERIVGTMDSTIPGQKVNSGAEAQAFAAVIRKHTLEATGGQTYAQMGRFLDGAGKPTNNEKLAAVDPDNGRPVENGLRNMWINATALSTALNTAYFAEQVATFAIVTGVALLLAGLGFGVLTLRAPAPGDERVAARAKAAVVLWSGAWIALVWRSGGWRVRAARPRERVQGDPARYGPRRRWEIVRGPRRFSALLEHHRAVELARS